MQAESLVQEELSSPIKLEDLLFLEELVNINSQSKNKEGVNRVQEKIKKRLEQKTNEVTFTENPKGVSGKLLTAKFKGSSNTTLTAICHADTVLFPTETFKFSVKADRAYGPGVADNKAGVLIAIKGIEYFLKNVKEQKLNIQFVSSPNEELGSVGFTELFQKMGKESQFLLGFEPALEDGSIIHSRNGNCWYKLEVLGQSAHSGRAWKGHINAAHDLCLKIQTLFEKCMEREDITFNVGEIKGGHSYNVICDKAVAKIDTRFSSFQGLDFITSLFEENFNQLKYSCTKSHKKTTTALSIEDYCPPLECSDKGSFYLDLYKRIIEKNEKERIQSVHCGGAADVNHFAQRESIAFDGLGPIAAYMHRKDEYVLLSSIESRAKSFADFLMSINEAL